MSVSDRSRQNRFIEGLSATQHQLLAQHLDLISLRLGQVVAEPARSSSHVFLPLDCVLSTAFVGRGGQVAETASYGRETAYGLLSALGAPASFERTLVQIAGDCLRLPTPVLRKAAEADAALGRYIIRHIQTIASQLTQSVACSTLHTVEARLSRCLLTAGDRLELESLPLTQDLLSEMLGVQRTTITAAASALRSRGLIAYRRGRLEIRDRGGLEKAACECYLTGASRWACLDGVDVDRPLPAMIAPKRPRVPASGALMQRGSSQHERGAVHEAR